MLRSTFVKTGLRGLIVIAIAGGLLLQPCTVSACSCVPPGTPQQELAASDVVFAGEVVSIQSPVPQFAFTSQFPFFGFFTSSADAVSVNFAVRDVYCGASVSCPPPPPLLGVGFLAMVSCELYRAV
jgi:hypothetical protein